ncbi:hypothetical protein WJX73_008015 [Symbiochloris irregularis]|uniref:K Homology domain-containing protein n=1 Tax=Symbiochloris irregularis TaxID=706552 RepID=A0AAW1PRU9_9CHLO
MDESVLYSERLDTSSPGRADDAHSNMVQDDALESNKRPRSEPEDHIPLERVKRQAVGAQLQYRLLCPTTQSGKVIGKGGAVVQQIREQTGATIKIGEHIQGCPDRIVTIQSTETADDDLSAAETALFEVHKRMIEGHDDAMDADGQVTAQLLIDKSQVGCLIGKGGDIVKTLRNETQAQIHIGTKDRPMIASDADELVQIIGLEAQVAHALRKICDKLRVHPAKAKPQTVTLHATSAMGSIYSSGMGLRPAPVSNGMALAGLEPLAHSQGRMGSRSSGGFSSGLHMHEANMLPQANDGPGFQEPVDITFWMLIPSAAASTVIGRSGSNVKWIREKLGAYVKINDAEGGSEDRVVQIGVREDEMNKGTAQEALFQCCKSMEPDESAHIKLRMLVPKPQIGAVLGRGGATINQLRAQSATHIKISQWEGAVPTCMKMPEAVLDVLEVDGRQAPAIKALRACTALLRHWQVTSQLGKNPAGGRSRPANGLRAPLRFMEDNSPLSEPGFDGLHDLDHGSFHLSQMMDAPRTSSPFRHTSSMDSIAMAHPSRLSQQPSAGPVRHMTIDANVAGCVIGKGGGTIKRIREEAGVNIKIADAIDGKRSVEFSGDPDRIEAAILMIKLAILDGKKDLQGIDLLPIPVQKCPIQRGATSYHVPSIPSHQALLP